MKVLLLLMVSLFAVSCASYHTPERDVASQDEEHQVKKQKKENMRTWDNKR